METQAVERRHLTRQVNLARPIFLVLALADLLEFGPWGPKRVAIIFVGAYLVIAVMLVALERAGRQRELRIPLLAEVFALGILLVLTPSVAPFWFLYLFLTFAAGMAWGLRPAISLAGAGTLALMVRTAIREPAHWPYVISWIGLAGGSFAAGAGIAFLGAREQEQIGERDFLARLTGLIEVDSGLSESIRRILEELRRAFGSELALLAIRDEDLERVFVWKVREGDSGAISPQDLPMVQGDAYLLDHPEASLAWTSLEGSGEGFGWERANGRRLQELPRLTGSAQRALNLHSVLTSVLEFRGQPVGRLLLCNSARKFSPPDLRWLERIARNLGPPLENLFLLRHLRARAIEGERSRISRDLHDGILQTLLSLDIQLDVLRRRVNGSSDHLVEELSGLQRTVRKEGEELRRMVTDMRPIRVQSADLVELMYGFAERFRNEAGLALELLVDSRDPQLSDRVCREIFQIYREALHNVKKHARATHVVVKLCQDEAKVSLVVDDNGQGFSFAGRFDSDELDRLRLGPISIKERTRSVGGTLTVESNPGHGAQLRVDIPLS